MGLIVQLQIYSLCIARINALLGAQNWKINITKYLQWDAYKEFQLFFVNIFQVSYTLPYIISSSEKKIETYQNKYIAY